MSAKTLQHGMTEELICPITQELMDEPVTIPTCGHTFDRDSLRQSIQAIGPTCPLCKGDTGDFDIETAPKNIVIANLIALSKGETVSNDLAVAALLSEVESEPEWSSSAQVLTKESMLLPPTQITKFEIKCTSKKIYSSQKSILLLVVDKSGSMAGSPIEQVKFSLKRILDVAKKYPSLIVKILAYDHGCENVTNPDFLHAGGGTSFQHAFDKIIEVLTQTKVDPTVTSATIVFLTDGQDNTPAGSGRVQAAANFKTTLLSCWSNPVVVHTIGFSHGHDFDYLNNIRLAGTHEGGYRFADPAENFDALAGKIHSITDTIVGKCKIVVKVNFCGHDYEIDMIDGVGSLWFKMNMSDLASECLVQVGTDTVPVPVIITSTNDQKLWLEWYSHLTDDLIAESIDIVENKEKYSQSDIEFYCVLLIQRGKSILKNVDQGCFLDDDFDESQTIAGRLKKIMDTIKQISSKQVVDKLKLVDIKFESQFKTTYTQTVPAITNTASTFVAPLPTVCAKPKLPSYTFRTGSRYGGLYKELVSNKNDYFTDDMCKTIDYKQVDTNGNTPLALVASVGRHRLFNKFIEFSDVNSKNNYGETVLDLAILYGYWKIVDELLLRHAVTNIDGQILLATCLYKKFTNTADRLIDSGISKVDKDMVNYFDDPTVVAWILTKTENDVKVNISTSIDKGIYANVIKYDEHIGSVSFKSYPVLLENPTSEHLKILDHLLSSKKIDPLEVWTIVNAGEEEICWPMFVIASKGNMVLFNMFAKYYTTEQFNLQNNKGTTALWIASCNKHVDMVEALLLKGVDVNLCNLKGDSALIPACQKGSVTIVKLLLENGINMSLHNRNRDNAVLICCRCNQDQVLDVLLRYYSEAERKEIMVTYADIDGFAPLLASTELDRTKCIRVLHDYGADLELRSEVTNQILPGATALHLACFYGRIQSAKMLHQLGSNVNSQTLVSKKTPLHLAIEYKHSEIVRFLLANGSDLNITDVDGRKPIFYALLKGNEEIYNEFFSNPLTNALIDLINRDTDKEVSLKMLQDHSTSDGCFEHTDIVSLEDNHGMSLLSLAILKNDAKVATVLSSMGASLDKPDSRGLTPSFWLSLMQGTDSSDPKVAKVRDVIKAGMQNKILMDLNDRPKSYKHFDEINNFQSKMDNGYNMKIAKFIIDQLKSSVSGSHSLLGFLDKNKIVPYAKDDWSQVIWNAKVHTIANLALNESELSPAHILAIYLYTLNDTILNQVNDKLCNWGSDKTAVPFICCLYQAFNKLPSFVGECYRCVTSSFDYVAPGTIIEWNAFSNGTTSWCNVLDKPKGAITFIINSKYGKQLGPYSRFPQNNEVVFLPGSQFVVKDYYVYNVIVFGQKNIRKQTFGASDIDIQKALDAKIDLIVELDEI